MKRNRFAFPSGCLPKTSAVRIFPVLLFLLFTFSCSLKELSVAPAKAPENPRRNRQIQSPPASPRPQALRLRANDFSLEALPGIAGRMAQTGQMDLRVSRPEEAGKQLDTLVQSLGGSYRREHYSGRKNEIFYDYLILLPSRNFRKLMEQIPPALKGTVLRKDITRKDIEDELRSTLFRLKQTDTYLEKYRNLLRKEQTRNKALSETVLNLQEKIRYLESDRERLSQNLDETKKRITQSALHLKLIASSSLSLKLRPGDLLLSVLNTLIRGWNDFVFLLLRLLRLWPFALLLFLIFVGLRKKKEHPHDPRQSQSGQSQSDKNDEQG